MDFELSSSFHFSSILKDNIYLFWKKDSYFTHHTRWYSYNTVEIILEFNRILISLLKGLSFKKAGQVLCSIET